MSISNFKAAIHSIPSSELTEYFENLRQEKYKQIGSADVDGLIAVKYTIKAINELELKFQQFQLDKPKEK